MTSKPFRVALSLLVALAAWTAAGAQAQSRTAPDTTKEADVTEKPAEPPVSKSEWATFGGGCFWCIEAVYERVPGVKSVTSGYMGGNVANPTYEMVHSGQTGHAEVVQLEFDPTVISYEKLVGLFFKSHDPTTLNRQGPDIGTQYRSVIFYHSDDQKAAARKVYEELTRARAFRAPIVTQLAPSSEFYPAEDYHQNFYRRNRNTYYSRTMIDPKLRKLEPKIRDLVPAKPK